MLPLLSLARATSPLDLLPLDGDTAAPAGAACTTLADAQRYLGAAFNGLPLVGWLSQGQTLPILDPAQADAFGIDLQRPLRVHGSGPVWSNPDWTLDAEVPFAGTDAQAITLLRAIHRELTVTPSQTGWTLQGERSTLTAHRQGDLLRITRGTLPAVPVDRALLAPLPADARCVAYRLTPAPALLSMSTQSATLRLPPIDFAPAVDLPDIHTAQEPELLQFVRAWPRSTNQALAVFAEITELSGVLDLTAALPRGFLSATFPDRSTAVVILVDAPKADAALAEALIEPPLRWESETAFSVEGHRLVGRLDGDRLLLGEDRQMLDDLQSDAGSPWLPRPHTAAAPDASAMFWVLEAGDTRHITLHSESTHSAIVFTAHTPGMASAAGLMTFGRLAEAR